MRYAVLSLAMAWAASAAMAEGPAIKGHYVEVRTCDVYTGPCFANSEMGLRGKEAILAWVVDKGSWDGVKLDGLTVVAAVKADGTLGDVSTYHGPSEAALVVDASASEVQKEALVSFAKAMGGSLTEKIVSVQSAPMEVNVGNCSKGGCASVKAGDLVEISTRCIGGDDHVCGNEESYYPPLTKVEDPSPAFTAVARFDGDALGLKWKDVGSRSAFLATFARG